MASENKNDRRLSEEKARFIFFLARWRGQLLIDETEGNSDAIELDRRVLDYYLDQYNELATFRSASLCKRESFRGEPRFEKIVASPAPKKGS